MDVQLIMPMLQSVDEGLVNTHDSMHALHSMIGNLLAQTSSGAQDNSPSGNGFKILAQAVQDALSQAQSDLSLVLRLIEELGRSQPLKVVG